MCEQASPWQLAIPTMGIRRQQLGHRATAMITTAMHPEQEELSHPRRCPSDVTGKRPPGRGGHRPDLRLQAGGQYGARPMDLVLEVALHRPLGQPSAAGVAGTTDWEWFTAWRPVCRRH